MDRLAKSSLTNGCDILISDFEASVPYRSSMSNSK